MTTPDGELADALARIDELEKALAHRAEPAAYTYPVDPVPWEKLSAATQERIRAKGREIAADLHRRGYRKVDNAAGKGWEAPPFEHWLWDLLNAIWPDNGPECLDGEVMGDALYTLSALHETSVMYKDLCR